MEPLYDLLEAVLRFLNSGPAFPAVLIYIAIAAVPVVLLHELGHAGAARWLLGSEVEVSVGSAGKLAELRLGQIVARINALSAPGRVEGFAAFDDSRATAQDSLLIAIAGPVASLGGTVITALLLSAAPSSGLLHDLLWTATLAGVFAVLNLIPFEYQERRNGPRLRTDGRLALDAIKVARALR